MNTEELNLQLYNKCIFNFTLGFCIIIPGWRTTYRNAIASQFVYGFSHLSSFALEIIFNLFTRYCFPSPFVLIAHESLKFFFHPLPLCL